MYEDINDIEKFMNPILEKLHVYRCAVKDKGLDRKQFLIDLFNDLKSAAEQAAIKSDKDKYDCLIPVKIFQKLPTFANAILEKYPGFVTDPASTKYHAAYEGGLFDHSLAVYEAALASANVYNLSKWEVNIIACVFHDLCKVNAYCLSDGKYTYNNNSFTVGHGTESLRRILNLVIENEELPFNPLTDAWELAVSLHMGAFESDNAINFSKITEKTPEVLLLHHADMIATKIYHV